MTIAQKVFWFFAVCLALTILLPSANTPAPQPTFSEDYNKCKNGDTTQVLTLAYDGKVIERLTVACPR
jgi:hypothetical protein